MAACSRPPATWSRQPSDDAIATATSDAQGAAEQAATTILAYDYRHLDEDQKAAGALMTPAYQKKYDALFAQIAANAPDVKAIVTADVVASGIVRSGVGPGAGAGLRQPADPARRQDRARPCSGTRS